MNPYPRLIMLGAEHETRGSIAAVVDAYRAHGLFQRWPIDYLPTHGDGGAARSLGLAFERDAPARLLLARHRRALVHLHLSARGNPARDAAVHGRGAGRALAAGAAAARRGVRALAWRRR